MADQKPKIPTQMHFGALDKHIPLSDVELIRKKRPECEIHVYPGADHGFNCDERGSYNKEAATLAWQRSMDWIASSPWWNHDSLSDEICIGDSGDFDDG